MCVFVCMRVRVQTSEDELSGKLASEQAAVAELQRQTAAIQASLEAERKLADKLRSDMQAASEQAKKLVRACTCACIYIHYECAFSK